MSGAGSGGHAARPFLILFLLVALIYGANLGDGPLSDDELYLERADRGAGLLLRSVTVDSAAQSCGRRRPPC